MIGTLVAYDIMTCSSSLNTAVLMIVVSRKGKIAIMSEVLNIINLI